MGNDTGQPSTLDSLELMLRAANAAPPIPASLAQGATVGGRYVIESVIGTGGMGVVYRARDQQLGRSVALKLHRTYAASDRLRREAVAMAKLAHPNVVGVYEVGEYEDRSFVAMEYIEGSTLRSWAQAQPRSRREVLDALSAAGDGLAAAHRAGLVHRDVKPENIFVGTDGRVRIGDFGLVRLGERDAAAGPVPELAIGDGTETGTVMGTPAYMAPEQLEGGALDARTDQFAFAVVAWELLSGKRPFVGGTTSGVRQAMDRGPTVASGKVPARLRRVLARALAVDPARRWPSVRAFVLALHAAERRPRAVAAGLVSLLVVGGVTTYAMWPAPDPMAACLDGPDELATALPHPSTVALVSSLATSGAETGPERADRLREAIAALRARHAIAARATCTARVERTWPSQVVDASEECLAAGRALARELLSALPLDPAVSGELVQLAASLPNFKQCGDVRALAGASSLVPAGVDRDAVLETRARADVLHELVALGHVASVEAALPALVAATVATVPSVASRLELVAVDLDIARGRVRDVEKRLSKVYFDARARDDGETMLIAVRSLIDYTSELRRDRAAAKRWSENGISDAEREAPRHPDAAATVLLAAASVTLEWDEAAAATALIDKAASLTTPLTPVLLRANIEQLRAAVASNAQDIPRMIAAMVTQSEVVAEAFGPRHTAVAAAYANRAFLATKHGHLHEALAAAKDAAAIIDVAPAPDSLMRADADVAIGEAYLGVAGSTEWELYLLRARATYVKAFGEDHPLVANIDARLAFGYNDGGDWRRALALTEHAAKVQEQWLGPDHPELAATLYGIAAAQNKGGLIDEALGNARRTERIFGAAQASSSQHLFSLTMLATILNRAKQHDEAIVHTDRTIELATDDENRQIPAWSRLEGARARIALGKDLPRALTLLKEARATFALLQMEHRVKEVDGLLADLRTR